MKRIRHVKITLTSTAVLAAAPAFAQSGVTLYGIVDAGIGYLSSSTPKGATGGKSSITMNSGMWSGSRFGLKGSEDLGDGTRAIFVLEEGFSSATGAQSVSGLAFNRQAFVGVENKSYGTFTGGRQYTSYYQLLSPYSPTKWLTGAYGAHPGDIDSLDTSYRVSNELKYTSPVFNGLTLGGSYALSGTPGSLYSGSTWSVAAQYTNGPIGIATGFMRVNNATTNGGPWGSNSTLSNNGSQPAVSAINTGYQTARAQQRFAVTAGYNINPQWDITASYSNVQYVPGTGSAFRDTAIFNTGGAVVHWRPLTALDLAAGYSYTRATKASRISSPASYSQFNLVQYYSLSKRTGLYAAEAYQRAGGQTLLASATSTSIVNATASIGDGQNSTPSSSRSQVGIGVGMITRF